MTRLTRRTLMSTSALIAAAGVAKAITPDTPRKRPNIVLFTLDDCDQDSLGCFGCKLHDVSSNIDTLAASGIRFAHAYTVSSTCQPSRLSLMTGKTPHAMKLLGHSDPLPAGTSTLPAILAGAGYYTAIVGKLANYLPQAAFQWSRSHVRDQRSGLDLPASADTFDETNDGYWSMWRAPQGFYGATEFLVKEAQSRNQPFFLHINTSDPHRPWPGSIDEAVEFMMPPLSKVGLPMRSYATNYSPIEVPLPGYLPDLPGVRVDRAQYLSAVRNADRALGKVVEALKNLNVYDNTAIICLSDQGAAFPMSKQSLYYYALSLGLVIRWPGIAESGDLIDDDMVSIADIMPTILDLLDIAPPADLEGKSFRNLFTDRQANAREFIFSEYNYARSGLQVYPMRAVHSKKYQYIFNGWAGLGGTNAYDGRIDTLTGLCWTSMKQAAARDSKLAARVEFVRSRVAEELYDIETDRFCLKNLAGDPAYASVLSDFKTRLGAYLESNGDPILPKFRGSGPLPHEWMVLADRRPEVHD